MFENQESNMYMLKSAYRKLKAYNYYNKTFSIINDKIATFEDDADNMNVIFQKLSDLLKNNSPDAESYFGCLLREIDYCVLPKKFVDDENPSSSNIASNCIPKNRHLNTVNLFADLPIELYILDTLWSLFLGKMIFDNKKLSSDVYGNTLAEKILFSEEDETINFESLRMFNIYFYKYCSWRNRAFSALESNYEKRLNSVLVSLDIKSYYYNIHFDFNLHRILGNHCMLEKLENLTSKIKSIYSTYFSSIRELRKEFSDFGDNEFPLPLGLFSSMLIGNIYLSDFDTHMQSVENCIYYGRYVDDIICCFTFNSNCPSSEDEIISETMVRQRILNNASSDFSLIYHPNLVVQKEKLKILFIDANESRAILDIFNKTIKILPSQINILPDYDVSIEDFTQAAYTFENFGKNNKLRDIGKLNINAFKVSRYFSALLLKHSNVHSFGEIGTKSFSEQMKYINDFFTGSRCIEYYSNWMNYMYFLILTRKYIDLTTFYERIKVEINSLEGEYIDDTVFNNHSALCSKLKLTLEKHLLVCFLSAIAIDIKVATAGPTSYYEHYASSRKFMKSNMFNHNLVSLPLANYLEYTNNMSYTKMDVADYGIVDTSFPTSFKVEWSPRFIHFEELLLAVFLNNHNNLKNTNVTALSKKQLVDVFYKINHITDQETFEILVSNEKPIKNYILQNVTIPNSALRYKNPLKVAVGNIKLNVEDCVSILKNRWKGQQPENKKLLLDILRETYDDSKQEAMALVLPELFLPIYWLRDVISFSKRTQVAVVTGLQYICTKDSFAKNYIAVILPFTHGKNKYRYAFTFIREKNDYSPIEKEELAKHQLNCADADSPRYQIFHWHGIDIATFVCYEFTDIIARALLKGRCDIIAAPVFNKDTTYFSNIIESSVRDLHTFIIQANTSMFGDSRITGPYDRDNKDIINIKGGDNNHVIVGSVDLDAIREYQANYYSRQCEKLVKIKENPSSSPPSKKPDIKKLSARFESIRSRKT